MYNGIKPKTPEEMIKLTQNIKDIEEINRKLEQGFLD